jgi:hypothetical protein
MYNNYFKGPSNTATIAGELSELLAAHNVYEDMTNPIIKQPAGPNPLAALVRVLDTDASFYINTTGAIDAGTDTVFAPAYSHVLETKAHVIERVLQHAGNTAATGDTLVSGSAGVNGGGAVAPGGSLTLTSAAQDVTPVSRQWYRNNFPIAGATGGTYSISNASAETHAGNYSVALVLSSGDKVMSGAREVTVGAPPPPAPPAITAHPAPQTVTAGGGATFSVGATGGAPLGYQWKRNGAAITGNASAATATLTIPNAQQSHAGTYTVTVSNTAGNVTSNGATLTVNPAGGNDGGNGGGSGSSGGGGGGGAPSWMFLAAVALLAALRKRAGRVT